MKNSFAPINRIPPEVLSLIPDHYDEDDEDVVDQELVVLTHVCHSWRNIFTSRPSLWGWFNFKNIDKTRTYIQRSQSSPLRIYIGYETIVDEAFFLITPHIFRTKSLTIDADALPSELKHFRRSTPLLEQLDINIADEHDPVLDGTLFNGDLSSLRELRLHGVITSLPWKNLANLQLVDLEYSFEEGRGVTRLLDFFESAPFLNTVTLRYPMLDSSDAPPKRIVPLLRLKTFTIEAAPPHSILLNHLYIPIGALLILEFDSCGEESLLLGDPHERSSNFANLSDITAINLLFDSYRKHTQLSGPSGSLRVLARWGHWEVGLYTMDCQILRSLDEATLSAIQRLSISEYEHPRPPEVGGCPVSQTLSFTSNLRTLTLTNCNNQPFILALDPSRTPSDLVLCPNMQELVLYNRSLDQLDIQRLIDMARNRASRGVKLSSIMIAGLEGLAPETETLELREYVTHVEYRVGDEPPRWDHVPSGSCSGSEQVRDAGFR